MKSSIIINIDVKTLIRRRDAKLVAPFIIWKLQQSGIPMMDWEPGTRHRIKDLCLSGQVVQVTHVGALPHRDGGRETTGLLRYFWMEGNPTNKELFAELRRLLEEKDGRADPPPSRLKEGKPERNS